MLSQATAAGFWETHRWGLLRPKMAAAGQKEEKKSRFKCF